ncbi:MAG TPA: hypothetical protein VJP88_05810 [Caulobacteraceae bacterium]|nr:hypothetical protein [Caulobacteraceae bacterium]
MPVMGEMVDYITDPELPGRLRPDGWGAELYRSVEAGEIKAISPPRSIRRSSRRRT